MDATSAGPLVKTNETLRTFVEAAPSPRQPLADRRVYGTTQPHRPLVSLRIDGVGVGEAGSTVELSAADAERQVTVEVAGTNPVERVTVVKNGEAWREYGGTTDPDADLDAYVVERT